MFFDPFRYRMVLGIAVDPRFVALGKIKDTEERLVFVLSLSPVRFSTRFVPRVFGRLELVIGFRTVGAVVTYLSHGDREWLYEFRQLSTTSHVMRADRGVIHPRDDGRSTRGADSGSDERLFVEHAFFCQLIDLRRRCLIVSVTTKVLANIFATDPYDVGPLGRKDRGRYREQQQTCESSTFRFEVGC